MTELERVTLEYQQRIRDVIDGKGKPWWTPWAIWLMQNDHLYFELRRAQVDAVTRILDQG